MVITPRFFVREHPDELDFAVRYLDRFLISIADDTEIDGK
jgi:hypothetical protein